MTCDEATIKKAVGAGQKGRQEEGGEDQVAKNRRRPLEDRLQK